MLLHNTEYELKIPMMPLGITPIIKVIPSVFQLLVAFSNKIVIYDTKKDCVIYSIELAIPEKKDLTKKSFQFDRMTFSHNISTPLPSYFSSKGLPLSHTAEVLPPPYTAIELPPPYTAIESPSPYTAIALPSSLPCTVNNDLIVSVDTVFDAKTKKVFFLISDCNKVVHIFLYDLINPITLEKKIELSKELNPNDKIVSVKIIPNKNKLFVLYNGSPSGIKIIPLNLWSKLYSEVETRALEGIGYSELKVVELGDFVALIVCVEHPLLDVSASAKPGFFIYFISQHILSPYYINKNCYSLFFFNDQLYEVVLLKKEGEVNSLISINWFNKITYNDSFDFYVAGIKVHNNELPNLNIGKNDFLVIAAQEGLLLLNYEIGLKIYLKPMNSDGQLLSSWIKIYENSAPLPISEPSVYKQADRDRSIILIKNTQSKFLVLDMKQILKEKESDISSLMLPKKDDVSGFNYGSPRYGSSHNVSSFSASKK
jgi:hypothetical protein